jgi:hypothetical protein
VDLDEKMTGVAASMVGSWQRQLNELGGVKPLACFSQYGGTASGPDLSSSWASWRRRVRTKRPSDASSPTAW